MNIHNEILRKWEKETEPKRNPAWAYSSAG